MDAWRPFRTKNAVWYRWRLNGAAAYVRRDRDAWQVAFQTALLRDRSEGFGGPDADAPPPGDLPVARAWGDGDSAFLHPYLSPTPYVLRAAEGLRLAPGRQCRVAADLPPLLKLELAQGKALAEESPFSMPRTFCGPDTMSGEICHSLPMDSAGPDSAAAQAPSAFVRCDILVRNNTGAVLDASRIIVRPEPLSVYLHQGRLVTDTLELDYAEADCEPRAAKSSSRHYHLVSAGVRYSAGESFARRSMGIIKDIASI